MHPLNFCFTRFYLTPWSSSRDLFRMFCLSKCVHTINLAFSKNASWQIYWILGRINFSHKLENPGECLQGNCAGCGFYLEFVFIVAIWLNLRVVVFDWEICERQCSQYSQVWLYRKKSTACSIQYVYVKYETIQTVPFNVFSAFLYITSLDLNATAFMLLMCDLNVINFIIVVAFPFPVSGEKIALRTSPFNMYSINNRNPCGLHKWRPFLLSGINLLFWH